MGDWEALVARLEVVDVLLEEERDMLEGRVKLWKLLEACVPAVAARKSGFFFFLRKEALISTESSRLSFEAFGELFALFLRGLNMEGEEGGGVFAGGLRVEPLGVTGLCECIFWTPWQYSNWCPRIFSSARVWGSSR